METFAAVRQYADEEMKMMVLGASFCESDAHGTVQRDAKPIEVTITGWSDCELCTEHYMWSCPGCGVWMDASQGIAFPHDEKCACGAVSRITEVEDRRWRRDVLGLVDA